MCFKQSVSIMLILGEACNGLVQYWHGQYWHGRLQASLKLHHLHYVLVSSTPHNSSVLCLLLILEAAEQSCLTS